MQSCAQLGQQQWGATLKRGARRDKLGATSGQALLLLALSGTATYLTQNKLQDRINHIGDHRHAISQGKWRLRNVVAGAILVLAP